jgi:hypothetical protein
MDSNSEPSNHYPSTNANEVDDEAEAIKDRHLQVWNRFFENAFRATENQSASSILSRSRSPQLASKKRKKYRNFSDGDVSPSTIKGPLTGSAQRHYLSLLNQARTIRSPDNSSVYDSEHKERSQRREYKHSMEAAQNTQSAISRLDIDAFTRNEGSSSSLPSLLTACREGNEALVEHLLLQGYDPNERDTKQRAAVHYAAYLNHHSILTMLFDYGADVDLQVSHMQKKENLEII